MDLYLIMGFIVIAVFGAILHFVYDWTDHNKFLAFFLPVNESTWEHLKLGLLPAFVWGIGGIFLYLDKPNFPLSWFILLLSIVVFIPLLFYSYKAITKRSILFVDISIYFISVAIGIFLAWLILNANAVDMWVNIVSIIGTIIIAVAFSLFTFFPPKLFLFKDPITGKYGRSGHFDDKEFGNNFDIHGNNKSK